MDGHNEDAGIINYFAFLLIVCEGKWHIMCLIDELTILFAALDIICLVI